MPELTAVFQKVTHGYIAFVEELPGANTQGSTLDEARANLAEAVQLVLDANAGVKRRDLIRHLRAHGRELLREGGNHSVYVNRAERAASTLPRHREVDDSLTRKICRDLKIAAP